MSRKKPGMRHHYARIVTSSKTHTWATPEVFLDVVRQLGRIKLDPAADHRPKRQFAKVNFTGKRNGVDGLSTRWRGHGLVYCNPPYGRSLHKWIAKACRAFRKAWKQDTKDELVMLVPARPDTSWFQDMVLRNADAVCFWKGRLKFGRGRKLAPAPFPSIVIYFGRRPEAFTQLFVQLGWTVIIKKD